MESPSTERIPLEISCEAVHALLVGNRPLVLVDCREPDEHAIVHISGSTLLPMSQLRDRVSELDAHRQQPLVIHCHHGGRSLKVAAWLREQGFPLAQSMAGGIDQWARRIETHLPRY